ncbi:MAG: hypothetical protein ACKVX9_05465 [Blastocatellia bacterium]
MNTKFTRILLTATFMIGLGIAAAAQAPKPVVYTTAAKLSIAKLKVTETETYDVRGKVTFTVTAANSDDTVAGTLSYTIPDDARQKISSMTGKQVTSIPSSVTRKDVVAGFQKATQPPVLHLEISSMDLDVAGVKVVFNRIQLDINAREGGNITKFSNEEIEALFTAWARQIGAGRARRGIIAAMNKRINGEDDN